MPAETSVVSALAGRYATALFELARDERALDAVADDLDGLRRLLEESDELDRLVRSPLISRDDQARAMTAVMERGGVTPLVSNFVGVLARNRRLFALDPMIRAFFRLLAEHRGEVSAEVASARPLTDPQIKRLRELLRTASGSDVNLTATVDEDLLGGLVVRLGSRMVDGSLKTKLAKLELAMKGAG